MTSVMIAEVSAVIFLASVFRTAFGFGEALIAVPILALVIPIQMAAPIAVLASILIASYVVVREWNHIHLGSASRLIFSTLFGLPLGLLLLKYSSEILIKGILAGVLILFSSYSLFQPRRVLFHDDRFAWIFGFFAGIMGGSYGVNGPPLAVYGSLRGWEPARFRATLQGYFLPASVCGMIGYGLTGLWTSEVNRLFLYCLPAIALGVVGGRLLSRRINSTQFARLLHIGLLLISLALIFQCAFKRSSFQLQ